MEKERKRKYGHRWIDAGTVFSTIKRMFVGEYVSATRFQTSKGGDDKGIIV